MSSGCSSWGRPSSTFSAGLIEGLWREGALGTDLGAVSDQQWRRIGSFAAALAADTASRAGADPPWQESVTWPPDR